MLRGWLPPSASAVVRRRPTRSCAPPAPTSRRPASRGSRCAPWLVTSTSRCPRSTGTWPVATTCSPSSWSRRSPSTPTRSTPPSTRSLADDPDDVAGAITAGLRAYRAWSVAHPRSSASRSAPRCPATTHPPTAPIAVAVRPGSRIMALLRDGVRARPRRRGRPDRAGGDSRRRHRRRASTPWPPGSPTRCPPPRSRWPSTRSSACTASRSWRSSASSARWSAPRTRTTSSCCASSSRPWACGPDCPAARDGNLPNSVVAVELGGCSHRARRGAPSSAAPGQPAGIVDVSMTKR